MLLVFLFACRPGGGPAEDPARRWVSTEPWGAEGLAFARDAEHAYVVDALGVVRSGPFVRADAPNGGYGRGWVDDTHFQLLEPDGTTRVFDRFVAVEPFDAADRAFAATAPAKWGVVTRQGLWLAPSLSTWHGPARVGDRSLYALASGATDVTVLDSSGAAVDVAAEVEAACGPAPMRARVPTGCASVADWAGPPRAVATLRAEDQTLEQRWYCGGVRARAVDGAELWTLPEFDSAAARALAEACGAPAATTRARPVTGGAELRLGPPPG